MNHLKFSLSIAISFICSLLFVSVSHAELLSDEKWSFDFKNISIADAFNEIERKTGIEIVLRQKSNEPILITYSNKDQSIFQIHNDMLRNANHTSSWNYSDNGAVKSINIVILGRGNRNDNMPVSNSMKQPTATIDERKNLRNKLSKPPEVPKVIGLRSPPMPPPSY
jgi:type II secretory pathway component GspD/PulD (secretin)